MQSIRGKNLKTTAYDIAEGYLIVNPLVLKSLDNETLKELYKTIVGIQAEKRSEKFPRRDTEALRGRNLRLQRLHSSAMIIRNFARTRKIILV
jgi:hypothetical protein